MSEYARQRAESVTPPLVKANDGIKQAFFDMQAALINELMGLLARYELNMFEKLQGLSNEVVALRSEVVNLRGVVEMLRPSAEIDGNESGAEQ